MGREPRSATGLGWPTPADVHSGLAEAIRDKRAGVLDAAYTAHPEWFVRKPQLCRMTESDPPEDKRPCVWRTEASCPAYLRGQCFVGLFQQVSVSCV